MKSKKVSLLLPVLFLIVEECSSATEFTCPKTKGDPLPKFPQAFSTDVRFNFPTQLYTIEGRHYVDGLNGREALELFTPKRHVKYIRSGEQSIFIQYNDNARTTCSAKGTRSLKLEDEDAGPNGILQKIEDAPNSYSDFIISNAVLEAGIYMRKWEACFKDPAVNISMGFTESEWGNPRKSALTKDLKFLVLMEAQINNDYVVATFDNMNPTMPDDVEFQPPENVYCEGYKVDKKPPRIPDYFSYDAEIITFESSEGISPVVSHRKVYYDYPSNISRMDFYDPMPESQDTSSKMTAQVGSFIHDFNSNVQYSIELPSGKCSLADYIITSGVVELKETKTDKMLTGEEFFSLNTPKMAYNGKFKTRGYTADVFTALVPHLDKTKGNNVYTWYFSTDMTQIVEKNRVETNVLLRMTIQPEAAYDYQGKIDVNFYNFRKDEPNALVYDLTSCYNEKTSKAFTITFPANNDLRGSETFLKLPVHLALKDTTGLTKQRIFVTEIVFNDKYMFAEFKIFDSPSVLNSKSTSKETSLSEAVEKLKKAISDGKFKVTVSVNKGVVVLEPEPDGFNEFSGDRKQEKGSIYKEGSVIGLSIGMLFLGVLLGGITINLIISRKFGVSLFQRGQGMNRFNNPLNESEM